jgi:hypothetical protein
MLSLEEQLNTLIESITTKDKNVSVNRMTAVTKSCQELLLWIDYLKSLFPESHALELLEGVRASMLETVAYIGIGLGRGAIGAMRTQIDLMLGFTYFYDHPREWEMVKTAGKGFQLRSDIEKYHKTIRQKFASTIAMIEKSQGISLLEVYKILSAHIHAQSPLTIPKAGNFEDLVSSDAFLQSLVTMQEQVVLCLSNYLIAIFISDEISPPYEIERRIKQQLSPEQRKAIFFAN